MSKKKVDQVIEYRISLQDKQSEQLDSMIAAYQINKVATPLVALISDVSAMAFLVGMLEATGVIDLDKGLMARIAAGVFENYEEAIEFITLEGIADDTISASPMVVGPLVKVWVWMMTTGRVLITPPDES